MTRARHGGRLSVIVVAAMTLGCGDRPPPALRVARPSTPSSASALPPIPGPPSPVAELAWGRDDASGQLAARLADGRFAAFRPTGGGAMTVVTGPEGEPPARCVALADAGRLATGHDAGVALWDTTSHPARLLDRLELGPVTALARVTGEAGEPALIAGCADGALLRVRVATSGRLERGAGHVPGAGPAVARIAVEPGGREVVALREDGAATRHRADLIGSPVDAAGPLRDLAFEPAEGKVSVRQIDAFTLELGPPPLRRFGAPGRPSSVALLDRGRTLAIGLDGGCVVVPIPASGPIPAREAIRVGGMAGTPVLAADPADPAGRTLALGDGAGRVERVGLDALIARGSPLALDDVPDLAYRPALRFGRPRTPLSPKADARLAPGRKAIEAGDPASAIASLAALERHDATEPEIAAEARALLASVEARSGEPSASVLTRIERAREAFEHAGRIDRAADMEFWRGLILARPFEPDASGRARRSSEEAGPALKRAASLYLRARPPLPRQARLAEAALAWVRLDLGDPSEAQQRWAAVVDPARADPVLAQVVELDRIDAALASAIGDNTRAESAYGRILARLAPGDRPALRRRAAIGRAAALMALGRPAHAAEGLDPEAPGDAEWTLRRLACRLAAGRPTRVAAIAEDDPVAAHARALIALAGGDPGAADLATDLGLAADGHRRAGRDDLALEADLLRAELAERSGRPDEAAERFAAVARALDALPDRDDARRGERPILALGPRARRGLARAEIAANRPGRVLAALAPPAGDRPGTIGLNREEFALAESLDRARRVRETDGGEAATLEVRRLATALAGRRRLRSRALDADGLGLSEDEALVAYAAVSPTATVGVLLRPGEEPRVAILPLGREPLAEAIGAWRAGLGDGGRPLAVEGPEPSAPIAGPGPEPDPFASPSPAPAGTLEARLYDALLGPFASDLDGVARLFVVPDGPLGGLPLEALGRDRRVIDRMEVAYLPAPGFLPALRSDDRADPASSDRLLFASPGAEREVRFWAVSCREAGWTVEALVGPRARPDALTGPALAPYPVVHLAAPAAPDPADDPALALTGGRWGASDLAAIPLRAKALVLQAEGASGPALRSWADAGLRAGAGAVVVTLWEPPALSARRFYAEFYRKIRDGEAPSRAVAAGRAAVAREPRFRDPVHWAGYVTYGP